MNNLGFEAPPEGILTSVLLFLDSVNFIAFASLLELEKKVIQEMEDLLFKQP